MNHNWNIRNIRDDSTIVGNIQDLNGWLEENGLRSADDQPHADIVTQSELDSRTDLEEQQRHVKAVYERSFPSQDTSNDDKEREERLRELANEKIDILTMDGTISDIKVTNLATFCDTVLTMCHWKDSPSEENFCLDLSSFKKNSVRSFLRCLIDKNYSTLSIESLIDCGFISHYLCAETVFEEVVDVLMDSINTSNCYCICQMARELDATKLFERSLAHMMDSIGDLESNEVWDDLTDELRDHIRCMKSAMESSLHSRGRLYFGSLDEYIAIFAERVQYYRERIAEAKDQYEENWKNSSLLLRQDTEKKIRNQVKRLRTLELALVEQKKLFLSTTPFRDADTNDPLCP